MDKAAGISPGTGYETLKHEHLLASPTIDLVYISLPNHLHEEWTIRALQKGKHVICEKPLGLDASSVERMLNHADGQGLLLYENLMYLHHPQHALVKEIIETERIGRIKTLRTVFGIPLPGKGNFRLDPAMGGGAFHDLIRYPLGTALHYLKGDRYRFQGIAMDRNGLNIAMHGTAITSESEMLTFSIAFGQQYESYYEIIGETGKIRIDRAYTLPADLANRIQVTIGDQDSSLIVPPTDHFRLMIEHVCDLINGNSDFRKAHARTRLLARMAEELERGCIHVET